MDAGGSRRLDAATVEAIYAAANRGDFDLLEQWLADDHVHHLPGVDIEMHGREETVRGLAMLYADVRLDQHPVRVDRFGPFVVALVEGSSVLREHLEGVHVFRLDADERIAEFWGITTPMPGVPPMT